MPLADPKPFRPVAGFQTQTELLRIETFDPRTGRFGDVMFGIAARGPLGGATARITETLDELSELVKLDDHKEGWDFVADRATIVTITGEFVDPLMRSLASLLGEARL